MDVSYNERGVVKKQGAKWHNKIKKWYVDNPRDYGSFTYFVSSSDTGDVLWNQNMNFSYIGKRRVRSSVKFFTDRSIYRPGQTLKFKGVAFLSDHGNNYYKVLEERVVSVSLRDANYQEVAKQDFVTNQFGSFSGLFTVPSNVLKSGKNLLIAKKNSPIPSDVCIAKSYDCTKEVKVVVVPSGLI